MGVKFRLVKGGPRTDGTELKRLELRVHVLQEALKKYGSHTKVCIAERYPGAWHCICGFEALTTLGEG